MIFQIETIKVISIFAGSFSPFVNFCEVITFSIRIPGHIRMLRTPYNFQDIYISNFTIHYNMRGFITHLIFFMYLTNQTNTISLISLFGMFQGLSEAPKFRQRSKELQKNSIQEVLSKRSIKRVQNIWSDLVSVDGCITQLADMSQQA